ncbi:hypothetical protein IWZ01DRAFT_489610 [Phyllosticta capitalensis]
MWILLITFSLPPSTTNSEPSQPLHRHRRHPLVYLTDESATFRFDQIRSYLHETSSAPLPPHHFATYWHVGGAGERGAYTQAKWNRTE